ncbi:MAG: hypothetical protein ACFCVK_14200 [Acidimicrobiales bacterium]
MSRQTLERKTLSALPPLFRIKAAFLAAGFLSLVLSVALWFSGSRDEGIFVGLWVPAIHSLGALVLSGERVDTRSTS